MTYYEEVVNAYVDSMRAYGVSEKAIKFSLATFNTGFYAGSLVDEDVTLQQEMVKTILNENKLN